MCGLGAVCDDCLKRLIGGGGRRRCHHGEVPPLLPVGVGLDARYEPLERVAEHLVVLDGGRGLDLFGQLVGVEVAVVLDGEQESRVAGRVAIVQVHVMVVHALDDLAEHVRVAVDGHVVEQYVAVVVAYEQVDEVAVRVDQMVEELGAALAARQVETGAAECVGRVQIGAVLEQQLGNLDTVALVIAQAREHHARAAVLVLDVDFVAELEEVAELLEAAVEYALVESVRGRHGLLVQRRLRTLEQLQLLLMIDICG